MIVKNLVALKDVLHNASDHSGANDDYVKGILVASVSVLIATGLDFHLALAVVVENTPPNTRGKAIWPESWQNDVQYMIDMRDLKL